jgi:hypothetical protein
LQLNLTFSLPRVTEVCSDFVPFVGPLVKNLNKVIVTLWSY